MAKQEERFGQRLKGSHRLARFIDARLRNRYDDFYMLSVFDGVPIDHLVYAQDGEASAWWKWLRTFPEGRVMLREIMFQILCGLEELHDHGVIHRDIQAANIVLCFKTRDRMCCRSTSPSPRVFAKDMNLRIINFGLSLDKTTLKEMSNDIELEGLSGLYLAPEAFDNSKWAYQDFNKSSKFDLWCASRLYLEILLSTKSVSPIQSTKASDMFVIQTNFREAELWDLCVKTPHLGDKCNGSEKAFGELIKARDPLHLGFPDLHSLRLVHNLLSWFPADRLNATQAIHHPYFLDMMGH